MNAHAPHTFLFRRRPPPTPSVAINRALRFPDGLPSNSSRPSSWPTYWFSCRSLSVNNYEQFTQFCANNPWSVSRNRRHGADNDVGHFLWSQLFYTKRLTFPTCPHRCASVVVRLVLLTERLLCCTCRTFLLPSHTSNITCVARRSTRCVRTSG